MDWSFLFCVGIPLVVMGVLIPLMYKQNWKVVDYIWQKAHNPALEHPNDVKVWNSNSRILTLVLVIGLEGKTERKFDYGNS